MRKIYKFGGFYEQRQVCKPTFREIRKQGDAVYLLPDMKFKTWRKLWIALAETEKELD